MKAALKRSIVRVLPLWVRKRLAIWINRQTWLNGGDRAYWAMQLLTDFARKDVNAYHKFLWRHHLAYAETYEVDLRFGHDNVNETRKIFFAELPSRLEEAGIDSANGIESVFEVGCSLGYLLHYMETEVFQSASRLEGIDIDTHAIIEGRKHLRKLGSRVKLHHGDMESFGAAVGDAQFDLVIASGVLLYLDQQSAAALVASMLRCTRKLLAVTALAHPEVDNRGLPSSAPRERDGTWIHNVDEMVTRAGGRIVGRRWEGGQLVDGNTIYFVYAAPAH